jgi:glucosamine-6-phosphate isomerase
MKLTVVENYDILSEIASKIIIETITNKPDSLLCLSTGNTPKRTYKNMQNEYEKKPHLFSKARLIKFDEWCDIPTTDECSCERYINKFIVEPLNIEQDRYFTYGSKLHNADSECLKINNYLTDNGPIDLILLGLGLNGHLGLIEPNMNLKQHAHVSKLSESTQKHAMLGARSIKPEFGITLGMSDIFNAKKAILLVEGRSKKEIVKTLLNGEITTQIPASLLCLHANVDFIIDRNAC